MITLLLNTMRLQYQSISHLRGFRYGDRHRVVVETIIELIGCHCTTALVVFPLITIAIAESYIGMNQQLTQLILS